jgi:hypothetical protein
MNISTYSITELGASHIKENKVCQDYSLNYAAIDGSMFIAIVSDGHGGETYCRSDRGSRFACETAMEAIKGMDVGSLVKGKSGQVPVRKQNSNSNEDLKIPKFEDVYPKIKDIDPTFEHLFQFIYSQWLQKVEKDWEENPPTKDELQLLGDNNTVKAYGATLIAFVRTPDYWYGFHIGDGKCLVCDEQGRWYEPILWDSDCFLNKTTSLCNNEAYKKFRYSFSGKGDFPTAVMLGTDGIDDSWGDKLPAYYTSVLEDISIEGIENAKESLRKSLPDLSKKGSKDDVSVSWIVDLDAIANILAKLKLTDLKQEYEILSIQNMKMDDLLKRKNEEQRTDIEKFKSDINFLNRSIETIKEKHQAEIKLLNKTIINANEKIDLYQAQIKQLEQKNRELENDKVQFKAKIDKHLLFTEKLAKLLKLSPLDVIDIKNIENYISGLQNEVNKLSKSIKDAELKIKTFVLQVGGNDNLAEDIEAAKTQQVDNKTEQSEQKKKIIEMVKSKIFFVFIGVLLGIGSTVAITKFPNKSQRQTEIDAKDSIEQTILKDTIKQKETKINDSIK